MISIVPTPTATNWQDQLPDPKDIIKPSSNIQSKGTSASTFSTAFQAAGANLPNAPVQYGGGIPTMDAAIYDAYKQQTPVGNEQRQVPGSATPAQPQAAVNETLAGISIIPTPIEQNWEDQLPDPKDIIQPGSFIQSEGAAAAAFSLGAGNQLQANMNGNPAGISIIPTPIEQNWEDQLPDPKDIIQPGPFIQSEGAAAAAFSDALQATGVIPPAPVWYQGAIPTMDAAIYDAYKQQTPAGIDVRA